MASAGTIQVKVFGLDKAIAGIHGLVNSLGPDGRLLMRAEGNLALAASMRAFRTQSDPATGTPWKKTSRLTLGTRPGGGGGGKTLWDTAGLMGSIQGSLKVTDSTAVIGTNKRYGRIHQEGGIIVPVHAKSLAIPMTHEARQAGSPRNFPRDLFFLKGHRPGSGMMAEAIRGNENNIRVHYLLLKSVRNDARPFMGLSAADRREMQAYAVTYMQAAVREGVI